MGGHHEHRESQGRSRSGAWEGYDSLHKALEGLASAKGVSQSRIGAVAKLAAHYAKYYKHVVHDIEVFLWKAEVEHRLAGLYAIDAIIRQAHAKNDPKDAYVRRFLIRLTDTIGAVKKVPEQQQPKVKHVIEEWQKRGVYTATQIEEAGGQEFVCSSNGQDERPGNITPRTSPGKLASLLSIIKQKKEEQDHTPHVSEQRPPSSYDEPYDRDRRQRDSTDRGSYNQREYDDRRTGEQIYDRRDTGGIMGDAPGVPLGGRIRRAPEDRESDMDDDSRDAKKARGSRHIHDPNATPSDRSNSEPKRKTVLSLPTGKMNWTSQPDILHEVLLTVGMTDLMNQLNTAGNRRRTRGQDLSRPHPSRTLHPLSLVLMHLPTKLDLTEPHKLYIMKHTVIAALEEVILQYLMLTPLRPRQSGAGCRPTSNPLQQHPRKAIRVHTPQPRLRMAAIPAAPPTTSKVLADDDDADTAEPEFTLQYDDDD
ncbi:hypothetical protein BBO99_00003057 [Phytophthora kernoviae]|uniref:CID domain-containing protein n=2 Tax=Phytophthora kernoviae TaxID=325452 RepID=A0A3R7K190_9STRA|nr:hypothetical protein G195_003777 [Phytophthora kernoviae 00238/432]RLN06406.1 hypothetical protein BBI17_003166 [Phytophthora kernoviae]RLN82245.1 hypothetical protein BBO99_00003057 [Phytophthora kernoviae]